MDTTHAAAGSYFPAALDARTVREPAPLFVQGLRVSAVVDADGGYTVFAGADPVATGRLDGTEGPLMSFFAGEAFVWSVGVDVGMNQVAAEQQAAAEAPAGSDFPQTVAEIITMVETLEGEYDSRNEYHAPIVLSHHAVLCALGVAKTRGINVEVKNSATDRNKWYIELNDGESHVYGQYHFTGH